MSFDGISISLITQLAIFSCSHKCEVPFYHFILKKLNSYSSSADVPLALTKLWKEIIIKHTKYVQKITLKCNKEFKQVRTKQRVYCYTMNFEYIRK